MDNSTARYGISIVQLNEDGTSIAKNWVANHYTAEVVEDIINAIQGPPVEEMLQSVDQLRVMIDVYQGAEGARIRREGFPARDHLGRTS